MFEKFHSVPALFLPVFVMAILTAPAGAAPQ